jgi:hypothetical protein
LTFYFSIFKMMKKLKKFLAGGTPAKDENPPLPPFTKGGWGGFKNYLLSEGVRG